ncbi:MAG: TetR/AcrR family transcriptional regulator [Dongiaceae bacterium]
MTAARTRSRTSTARLGAVPSGVELGPMRDYVGHLRAILEEADWPKGQRTRFRLKIAAIAALAEGGYQDLKVSDICERAEVAQGTFYSYFTDKGEISAEALLEFGDALYQQAQSTARGGGPYQAILRTNRFFAAAYQLNSGLVRCLIQLEDLVPDFRSRWREARLLWLQRIARSLARRSGYPTVSETLLMQMAYALEGMVFTYLYDVFVRREPILQRHSGTPEHIADLLSLLWYRAVYCQDPPAGEVTHARTLLDPRPPPQAAVPVALGARRRRGTR